MKLVSVPVKAKPLIVPLVPATDRLIRSVVLPVLVGVAAAMFKPEAVLPAAAPEFWVKAILEALPVVKVLAVMVWASVVVPV